MKSGSDRIGAALLVVAVHLVIVWLMATAHGDSTPIDPPTLTGMLVSPPTTEAPAEVIPKPPTPQPKPPIPAPTPKQPPPPKAPPSEHAVTTPIAPSPAPVDTKVSSTPAEPVATPAAPVAAASAVSNQAPVVLPRSDASYLNNAPPDYPRVSRRLRQTGRVLVDVMVLASGTVGEAKLKRSSGYPLLDEAALAAVKNYRFVPASRGGKPIDYWYVMPFDFNLE